MAAGSFWVYPLPGQNERIAVNLKTSQSSRLARLCSALVAVLCALDGGG
jgi:hypothetical protein